MAISLLTERLRSLPAKADAVWQGGVVRIPGTVAGDDGVPFGPALFLWVSLTTGQVHPTPPMPAEAITPAFVVQAMVDFATGTSAGYRPGRVEVADADQAAALAEVGRPVGIDVGVVRRSSAVEAIGQQLLENMPSFADEPPDPPPPLTDDPAITPDRLAAFADAAAAFYSAAPWQHFGPTDLLRVASPPVPERLRYASVMGGGGEQFGLGFFPSTESFGELVDGDAAAYATTHEMVAVTYDPATLMPPGDVAVWRKRKLPTAKRGRTPVYPLPLIFNRGTFARPTPAELATMEGWLRAVTRVTPADLDAGEWTATMPTADGPVTLALEYLPDGTDAATSTDPTDPFGPGTPPPATEAERLLARGLFADAGPAAALALRALALDPTLADAHVLLGDTSGSHEAANAHYREAIAVAERALDDGYRERVVGRYWLELPTRPLMRGLAALATNLLNTGHADGAVAVWQDMLRLNPNDNQGVRDLLACELLAAGRDAELSALLERYDGDGSVAHRYTLAAVRFRAEGDTPATAAVLRAAIAANKHAVPYLTGGKPVPASPGMYTPGQASEAAAFAPDLVPAWQSVPGAVDWLKAHAPAAKPKQPAASKRRRS